jgi:hypothetical protein
MALIGMRDIRDYLVQVRPESESRGLASPFNIKKKALTLANFNRDEIKTLYHQHTDASGQIFESEAIDRAWYWSEGQPWLVNAIAYEVVVEILKNDYSKNVTADLIDQAAEALIQRRDTHIDSLMDRLKESRIRRVMEPVILGLSQWPQNVLRDDKQYVLDLGLLKVEQGVYKPANPIYQEVIIRDLTYDIQDNLPYSLTNRWMDGHKLDMTSLLKEFQTFWQENSEIINSPYDYFETTPHLVCFAFLQRVLNGGVETLRREYALGMRRLDLMIKYKGQAYPVELKIRALEKFVELKRQENLKQLRAYMDKCGAKEGWLVVFDRDTFKSWDEKLTWEITQYEGATIHEVGC